MLHILQQQVTLLVSNIEFLPPLFQYQQDSQERSRLLLVRNRKRDLSILSKSGLRISVESNRKRTMAMALPTLPATTSLSPRNPGHRRCSRTPATETVGISERNGALSDRWRTSGTSLPSAKILRPSRHRRQLHRNLSSQRRRRRFSPTARNEQPQS